MRKIGIGILSLLVIAILFVYPLDSYISRPGGAYELSPIVKVEGGDEEDIGTFSLMTISIMKATPVTYAVSYFSDRMKVLPVHKVRREGEDENEYNVRQLKMMSDSQFNAITVAFDRVGLPVEITFDGIAVMQVVKDGAAYGKLEAGDIIRKVNDIDLVKPNQFAQIIAGMDEGETVDLTVERGTETINYLITLKEIPGQDGKVGLGISFIEDRDLSTDPPVHINTADIGGPSAGLMFTLEIMNQLLLNEDLTKGYTIAGTGEMLPDGTVGRIGGIDFKVMAAAKQDIEIFFAPDDEIPPEMQKAVPAIQSNYDEAVKTAEKIGTDMKIVPVRNVDDALKYLKELPEKE